MTARHRRPSRLSAWRAVAKSMLVLHLFPYSDEATTPGRAMASTADAALDSRSNSAALGAGTSCTSPPTASTVLAAQSSEEVGPSQIVDVRRPSVRLAHPHGRRPVAPA